MDRMSVLLVSLFIFLTLPLGQAAAVESRGRLIVVYEGEGKARITVTSNQVLFVVEEAGKSNTYGKLTTNIPDIDSLKRVLDSDSPIARLFKFVVPKNGAMPLDDVFELEIGTHQELVLWAAPKLFHYLFDAGVMLTQATKVSESKTSLRAAFEGNVNISLKSLHTSVFRPRLNLSAYITLTTATSERNVSKIDFWDIVAPGPPVGPLGSFTITASNPIVAFSGTATPKGTADQRSIFDRLIRIEPRLNLELISIEDASNQLGIGFVYVPAHVTLIIGETKFSAGGPLLNTAMPYSRNQNFFSGQIVSETRLFQTKMEYSNSGDLVQEDITEFGGALYGVQVNFAIGGIREYFVYLQRRDGNTRIRRVNAQFQIDAFNLLIGTEIYAKDLPGKFLEGPLVASFYVSKSFKLEKIVEGLIKFVPGLGEKE